MGVPGELYIGGANVTRGYRGSPGLTADRFVPNPFAQERGARMYRTGDLAQWRPDGVINYIHRIDFQVKIRGFRVELGEVESLLLAHQDVREAVVVVNTDRGNKQLVAYVVPHSVEGDEQNSFKESLSNQLTEHLRSRLPQFMVPNTIIILEVMPLTQNGKLDRGALAARPLPEHQYKDPIHAPQTPTEILLAGIMGKLLGVENVYRNDRFFDIGGDSLRLLQFMKALEASFNILISPAAVILGADLATLAARIDAGDNTLGHLVTLNDSKSEVPLFCMHTDDGSVNDYFHLARYLSGEELVYGLRLGPSEKHLARDTPLDQLSLSYIADIRKIQPKGPYKICGYSYGGVLAFDIAHKLSDLREEVQLILIDPYRLSPLLELYIDIRTRIRTRILLRSSLQTIIIRICKSILNSVRGSKKRPVEGNHTPQRNLHRAAFAYKYKPYFGPVVLFVCDESERNTMFFHRDGRNGFAKLLKGPLEIIKVDGEHFQMLKKPAVLAVAEDLRRILARKPC